MNKFNAHNTGEDTASGTYGESSSSIRRQRAVSYDDQLAELEMENSRLHRLVAELLIKNQQLRKSD
ncbi:MAG TPA: hypothetical protein VHS13_11110 [Edaphobacter sp.]|jgi:hypothetical protein|nr:hypothetical protein [Edaphobacter sp.]